MADGTLRRVRLRGDEFFNWAEDEHGFAVVRGGGGRWQYATRAKGRWVPAGMAPQQRGLEGRASDPPVRTSPFAASDGSAPVAELSAGEGAVAALAAPPAPAKLLVILVSFADKSATTSASSWNEKFFGASGKTINTYYQAASKNRFWFSPADEAEGTTNDGVISVTLAINHPDEQNPTVSGTQAAVSAALTAADPYINYASFNANGDGFLSTPELHLALIFAGGEYAYLPCTPPAVWAHHWSLSSPPRLDGVYLGYAAAGGGYAAFGEYHDVHAATIGVICHELGHNLTLPDLYDTDYSSDGVGAFCLMGAGNWGRVSGEYAGQTPVLPSAYCRQLIGFSDVRQLSGEAASNALLRVSDSTNLTDMVRLNTPNSQQYFLVENRQIAGFDAGLYRFLSASSGGGLAVWHVDESVPDNANDARRLVDLEEASLPALDVADDNCEGRLQNLYYGGNATRFDETTFPSNFLYGGAAGLARVYSISASGPRMTFVGEDGASLEAAVDVGAAQAFASGGSAAWADQAAVTHDGRDAAQSGSVTRAAPTSWMSTVVTGPVQVAFWWNNSASDSETLTFLVDGSTQASVANTATWVQQSQSVGPGIHTLRWELATTRKNGSANAAFVDQLTVSPIVTALAVDAPPLAFPWQGGSAEVTLRNTGNAEMLWTVSPPTWCSSAPSGGTLAAGATQTVSVVCATNATWQSACAGFVMVSGSDAFGAPAVGSPVTLPVSQAAHPTSRATFFSVR